MNLTIVNDVVAVSLSQKNLDGLRAQVAAGEPLPQLMRRCADGLLIVSLEPDEAHYSSPLREPEARGRAGVSGPEQPGCECGSCGCGES